MTDGENELGAVRSGGAPSSPGHHERRAGGRRLEDRVQRARDAASLAVHELRAPLTVAVGYASLILDGSLGPASDRWLKAVEIIADKLLAANTLVDSLLLLARLDDEDAAPIRADFDLVAAASAGRERAQSRADQIGGTFIFETENAEVHALGDQRMVATVVDNLLNNALLYGGEAPAVTIHVGQSEGPTITVTDHGRGIPVDARRRIFERFFRVVDHSPVPGSGLGLYLCSQLARRQGGTVSLDWSELGQGSAFSLRLPAALAATG